MEHAHFYVEDIAFQKRMVAIQDNTNHLLLYFNAGIHTCALKFGTSFLSIHICEHIGDEVDFSPPNTQFPYEREMLTDLKRGDFTE